MSWLSDRERCIEAGMNDYVRQTVAAGGSLRRIGKVRASGAGGQWPWTTSKVAVRQGKGQLDLASAMRDIGEPDLFATMAGMLLSEWDEHLGRLQEGHRRDRCPCGAHARSYLKSLLAMFHAENARRRAMEIEQAATRR
jgi:two-component system sensor histidine kinase/response regulator